jgi:Fe-Mn family superoxide dismutase
MYNFIRHITLNEGHTPKTLEQSPLPYDKDELEPVKSEKTIDYHYDTLYKGYVDRYNKGEGDSDFNEAGAFLHDIYFKQFHKPIGSNHPEHIALNFINKHFKTFDNFQDKVQKTAMSIQGSGWVYLARDGSIKTIRNHEIRMDIILLIDWWEHAWALDYQADKKAYLRNIYKIINWNIVSSRIGRVS